LKGQPPPNSVVKNVTLSNIKGSFGSFGQIQGNPGQTEISDITLQDVDVHLENDYFDSSWIKNFKIHNVTVNGKPFAPKTENK
jgi:hypothetical protein